MTRRQRPPARSALWRDRRFCVFLTSQTLSVAGDSFALIAVPLPRTQHRPSTAMCRMVDVHVLPASQVGATYTSQPCAKSEKRASGM